MMEGQHTDAGTQPDGRSLGGDMRKDGHQRRKDAIAAGMVLCDPDGIEPECLGIADLLEGLVIDASLVGSVVLSPGGAMTGAIVGVLLRTVNPIGGRSMWSGCEMMPPSSRPGRRLWRGSLLLATRYAVRR